ncbi:hypothetical protein ACS0TY_003203 [Phlomoides rotata]
MNRGFRLPASHVIHTVGPIYDVDKNPGASLKNAYRNSLRVATFNTLHLLRYHVGSMGILMMKLPLWPYLQSRNLQGTSKRFVIM